MMNTLTLLTLGLAAVKAGDTSSYDYRSNGENWGKISADCDASVPNQSPIDLISPKEVLEKKSYPIVSSEVDSILKDYNNVKDVKVGWTGDTSKIDITNQGIYNRFIKDITDPQYQTASYYAGPTEFNAVQFHFHSGSEHTVDGYHYDLEMHTVHEAKEDPGTVDGISHAAVGILFDAKYFTAKLSWAEQQVIDNFFDSMKWDDVTGEPQVDVVNYGVLMTMVDFNNRYTYRGSVTTPPCHRYVHWNVLSTVYPIQQKHIDQFKSQMARNTVQQPPLTVTGNWRATQPINGHNVMFIKSEQPTVSAEYYAMNESGELYLLEGAEDYRWLEEQEAAKYVLEETKPGQYHYVARDDPAVTSATAASSLLPMALPTITLNANKLLATVATAASIMMTSM